MIAVKISNIQTIIFIYFLTSILQNTTQPRVTFHFNNHCSGMQTSLCDGPWTRKLTRMKGEGNENQTSSSWEVLRHPELESRPSKFDCVIVLVIHSHVLPPLHTFFGSVHESMSTSFIYMHLIWNSWFLQLFLQFLGSLKTQISLLLHHLLMFDLNTV